MCFGAGVSQANVQNKIRFAETKRQAFILSRF